MKMLIFQKEFIKKVLIFLKKWNKIGKNNPGIYEKLRNLPGKNNEEQLRAYNEICRNMK